MSEPSENTFVDNETNGANNVNRKSGPAPSYGECGAKLGRVHTISGRRFYVDGAKTASFLRPARA